MSDAHDELAALALGLQKTVQRRGRLGARRMPPGAPAQSQIDTPPQAIQPANIEAPPEAPPAAPAAATPASQAARAAACPNMEQLGQEAAACQACSLHQGRENPVFSEGAPKPGPILFLGESPSPDDHRSGIPFSGAPGQLM
ncbi:MAG: hypothetical protein P1U53_17000, partial [Sulfitobacter sp.]|nr:hypothetical protein [Sulfitobacter sp.]